MKYIKIYEKFEDFEEVWEEEPLEQINDYDFKIINQMDNYYLIERYIDEHNIIIYKNYNYHPYKLMNSNTTMVNDIIEVVKNNHSIKIYNNIKDDFIQVWFKDLNIEIQKNILDSYGLTYVGAGYYKK